MTLECRKPHVIASLVDNIVLAKSCVLVGQGAIMLDKNVVVLQLLEVHLLGGRALRLETDDADGDAEGGADIQTFFTCVDVFLDSDSLY